MSRRPVTEPLSQALPSWSLLVLTSCVRLGFLSFWRRPHRRGACHLLKEGAEDRGPPHAHNSSRSPFFTLLHDSFSSPDVTAGRRPPPRHRVPHEQASRERTPPKNQTRSGAPSPHSEDPPQAPKQRPVGLRRGAGVTGPHAGRAPELAQPFAGSVGQRGGRGGTARGERQGDG